MIKAIYIIWLRGVKQSLRQRVRFISHLGQPLLWMFLLGTGLRGSVSMESMGLITQEIDYMAFMLPGIIGMTLLFSSMMGGMRVLYDKKFGFLKELMVAPISRVSIVLGINLASATISILQGTVIILLASLIGINLDLFHIPIALLFIFMIGVTFTSLGVALATKMEDIWTFQGIQTFVNLPLFLLSGAFFPITKLPYPIQMLAYLNPLFYGVDGLRSALIGVSTLPMWFDLLAVISFCAALILLSTYLFNKSEGM
ncbi:MAG: ABC transporter permease [Candidatus Altiarchaeota archaeon]|nr:ABC transporter permease [Candidatus Altiarchaeota archaeon]